MRYSSTIVATLLLAVASSAAQAQTRTISGRLTDVWTALPLSSGRVLVKGTSIQDQVRPDGVFVLRVPPGEVTIVAEADGYRTRSITVSPDQAAVFIALASDALEMEDLVVTGHATDVDRRHAAASVSRVSGDDVSKVPAASVEEALQGKVPGADIQRNSGTPGGDLQLRLRGVTTILGSAAPLYVVDGVILSNADVPGGTSAVTGGLDFVPSRVADLNPNDIESIQILKGASASTLYGSKGANGVVIIKTKRGGRSPNP